MVLKKLSKKIMAYTLTTAMMTGFFAVSNLTTAWASTGLSSGDLTVDSTDTVTLAGDVTVDGSSNTAELEANSLSAGAIKTISMGGTTAKLVVPSGKKLTIAANMTSKVQLTGTTKKIDTPVGQTCVIEGPVDITKDGISGTGTITGGVITGATIECGTVSSATLDGVTFGAEDDSDGKTVTLNNCKGASSASTLTVNKANTDKTNTVKVTGTFECGAESATSLAIGSGNGNGIFNFDNATVTGKVTGATGVVITGNIKASSLDLSGAVSNTSNAIITLKDGINKFTPTANASFSTLTLVRGADFKGTTCKATVTALTVESVSAKLFKYSSADEANFVDGMLKGNIVVTGALDEDDSHGYGAHLQGVYLTYGLYDFDYAKSGQKVDVTCVAKGNKYDGTKFSVTVKPEVEVGIADIDSATGNGSGSGVACEPEFSEVLLNLSDDAKSVKTNKTGLWAAFQKSCLSNACSLDGTGNHTSATPPGVDDGYTVKFYREVSGVADTMDVNLGGTIVKKNISNAVVNGLHANGIDSYDTDDSSSISNTAALLPDGFVSIELGATIDGGNVLTAGTQTAFTSGTLNSSTTGTTNVYLVYKTEDGKLKNTHLDDVKGSALTWNTTSGNHTQSVVAASGNYTGSVSVPYEIVDAIVDGVTYNGNARTASVSGAQSYSVNGITWTTDAPTFTDAGTYTFNYKLSDGVAKTATFTIKPATVTPVWNINSTGAAIEYDYDGKAKTRNVVGVSGDSSLSQSILDKFDTSAITYKYYYDATGGLTSDKKEVKECIDATESGKCYYVVPIADRKVNKNFKFSTTSNPAGIITIKKVAASLTSKKDVVAYYDGAAHSVDKVTVNAPEGSYKVLYGTAANNCQSTTAPTYKEVGTYTVYYVVSDDEEYNPITNGKVNVSFTNTKGSLKLDIKPALSMKRTDDTKEVVTYTGKYFPIKADAYSGDSKESDVKVVIYARKDNGKFTKVTDGIKDVGLYTFKYAFVVDGKEGNQIPMDDTVTIKAAAKKSIAKATTSVKNVTYNGKNQTAKVTVKYGNTTLKLNKDYTLKNATHINAGSFKVTITGKGNYTGTKTVIFKIAKRKVTKKVVIVKRNKKTFTVYVKIGKKNYKVAKTNYKLTAKYNKKTKKYAVTVAFKVNYSGTVKKTVK